MSTQTARAGIAVANAPVSYGAFEITVGHDPNVPDGITVLDQVAAAGYAGIDLGPVGYLGSGTRLGELLAERAKSAGVEGCVFDRGGYQYHGRVAALAEGAREGGLTF